MTIPECQQILSPLQPGAISTVSVEKFISALCTKADIGKAAHFQAALAMTAWMADLRDQSAIAEMVEVMTIAAKTMGQLSSDGSSQNGKFLLSLALITGIGIGWLTGREQVLTGELERLINGQE